MFLATFHFLRGEFLVPAFYTASKKEQFVTNSLFVFEKKKTQKFKKKIAYNI